MTLKYVPKTKIKVEGEVFKEIMNWNRCFHVEYNNIEFQKGDIIGFCARFKTGMLSIVITHFDLRRKRRFYCLWF